LVAWLIFVIFFADVISTIFVVAKVYHHTEFYNNTLVPTANIPIIEMFHIVKNGE
jgi:hypothetical protein